jgi:hypothetical protein
MRHLIDVVSRRLVADVAAAEAADIASLSQMLLLKGSFSSS